MSEPQQLRILARTSLGRLMDAAVASRGIDATQFVIWAFALVATPPFFFAARMMGKYAFMWRQPELLERTAIADRLFFIVYSMLASALLAALLWEALFPDRRDQEIVGVLPVRARTLAAARLGTALAIAALFSLALALPSGFFYALNVAAGFKSASIVGTPAAVFVTHVAALTLAGMFAFSLLLAARAIAVACVGAEMAQRAATLLQLVTIVMLVESLIFLPGLLDGLAYELTVREAPRWWVAPLWFTAFYAMGGGPPGAVVPGFPALALASTAAVLLFTCAAYLLPARWVAQRTREARPSGTTGRTIALAGRLAAPALREPAARATFGFTLASLARSRQHTVMLATYVGAAIALAAVRFAAAHIRDRGIRLDVPADYLLALPLVFTFFLVAALRSAWSVPTTIEGNWTFRIAHPRSASVCIDALGVALVAMAVLPISLAWVVLAAPLWSAWEAAASAAMHAASGAALVEIALIGCCSIPFTRPHVASVKTVRGDWILALLALHVFAFRLDDVQLAVIQSPAGVGLYVAAMALVALAARAHRHARLRDRVLEFDAPDADAPATLNLSQATG